VPLGNRIEQIEAAFSRLMRESTISINGKVHPEQITFRQRAYLLFSSWKLVHRAALAPLLSPADLAVMDEYALVHRQAMEAAQARFAPEHKTLLERAASMSGLEIAQADADIEKRSDSAVEARYRKALDKLSTEGRTAVGTYAWEHIRPTTGRSNYVAIAERMPDAFKLWVLTATDPNLPPPQLSPDIAGPVVNNEEPPEGTPRVGIATSDDLPPEGAP
jgi:hypothetical protein